MEKFNWKALQHFMSTNWKRIPGELDDILYPRNGKVQLEDSAIFNVHAVEKFN